jgi:hypothetical protein
MHLPVIQGVIARRLLVNYRIDPDVIVALLTAPSNQSWPVALRSPASV